MKKIILVISLLCLVFGADAKTKYKYYPNTTLRPDRTIFLYVPTMKEAKKALKSIPDPVHAKKAETLALTPIGDNGCRGQENMFDPNGATLCINEWARFDLFFPKESNGKMIVVIPGGGYNCVCHYIEGVYAADWFVERGYTVAVVKYRLPYGHWNVPLTDVQNVFRYCRYHAAEWGVKQIGVMGFSAGGHLAATASTLYCDAVTRPDFSVLVYPVISSEKGVAHEGSFNNLIGTSQYWTNRSAAVSGSESTFTAWSVNKDRYKGLKERYSLDKQVSTDTPKTFIIFSSNDGGVPPENEVRYYNALLECGVPCEMHAFPGGGHGYGFKSEKYEKDPIKDYRADFLASMARFLSEL